MAVLSVVLFHFGSTVVSGGYAGVDVFFVISGYLITGLIYREIADGSFRILTFYERRMRRIFPALLVTMAAVFAAGFVIFMPDELRDLGASMFATTVFCSNILFWLQTDYFAGPAEFKPLLHTWSLAVEEQFYIVIPALMIAIHRWTPQKMGHALLALTFISFGLSCLWVFIDSSGNYYFPHTRAWELLAGSLIALGVMPRIANERWNEAVALCALGLLIAPLFLLSTASVFPAWNALPTCLGTALLIHTGDGRRTNASRILSAPPLVGLGLISYSLYLIHWPVIVFVKYQLLRDPTSPELAIMALAVTGLAWVSWRFIEQPFRSRSRVPRRMIFMVGLTGSAIVAAMGIVSFVLDGLPQRLGSQARFAVKRDESQDREFPDCFLQKSWRQWQGKNCFLTHGNGPVVLLWGDSHAAQFAKTLHSHAAQFNSNILLYASAGCPPILGHDILNRPDCRGNNEHVFEVIRQYGVTRVVLSGYWQREMDYNGLNVANLGATVGRLAAMGVDASIIGDNPDFPFANPAYLGLRLARRPDPSLPFYTGVRNDFGFNGQLATTVDRGHFYDPMNRLCQQHKCLVYEKGELMMVDNAHLSNYGAAKVLRDVQDFFR